jgi:hypothetical protein
MNDITSDIRMLYHIKKVVLEKLEKMIEGCDNVKDSKEIHKDAKSLADAVGKDCQAIVMFLGSIAID